MSRILIWSIAILVAVGIGWVIFSKEPSCGWDRKWTKYTQCIPGTDKPLEAK